ncbi:ATP-binding protein [Desulfotomaculum copahuensis]|uniref:Uncharacterized protein n=1 Tax=Desulfotomaculum copahuensis TaxID=1838280 RepID=A0A1B7LCY5_9FIRM|nr:ATP-binding protein [Desulfotomaculum copahuensis]OAT80735.1 hypothetical protein A6M21_12830 [Desulfotomaculum copahuensis]
MNKSVLNGRVEFKRMALLTSGLVLYQPLTRDNLVRALQELLEGLACSEPSAREVLANYHRFCALAVEHRWPEHLLELILDGDNSFSRQAAAAGPENVSRRIKALAARDLSILQKLAAIDSQQLKHAAADIFKKAGFFRPGEGPSNAAYDPLVPENWPGWEETPAGPGLPRQAEMENVAPGRLNFPRTAGNGSDCPGISPPDKMIEASYPIPGSARNTGDDGGTGSDDGVSGDDGAVDGGSTGIAGAAAWLTSRRQRVKNFLRHSRDWSTAVDELARFYHRVGCGVFSRYAAFRWRRRPGGESAPAGIAAPDPVRLEQLIGLKREKALIRENTEHFLAGLPASNIILYGDRGTGKSSTVKALLNTYAPRGLRLVEMAKADLGDFPLLIRQLAGHQQKFIIFVDDLSFDETEPEYRALKTVLEGGLAVRPDNVLIYATSNRRHLVKESFSERQGDEVHARDSMEEKLSLADRFGITVTFPAPDQEGYLRIVEELAGQRGLEMDRDELRQLALHWEMWHNGRSGRTARQFVDYLAARAAGSK